MKFIFSLILGVSLCISASYAIEPSICETIIIGNDKLEIRSRETKELSHVEHAELMGLQNHAHDLRRAGDREGEIKAWETLLEKYPNDVWGLTGLARTYRESGQIDKAILYYKKAIELGGTHDPISFMNLAKTYIEIGDKKKGVAVLKALLERHPEDDQGRTFLAKTLMKLGREKEALEELDKIKNPDERVATQKAAILIRLGRFDEVLAIVSGLDASRPDAEFFFVSTKGLVGQKRYKEALVIVEKAESVYADKLWIPVAKAEILNHLGRFSEALAATNKITSNKVASGYSVKALTLYGLGRHRMALDSINLALKNGQEIDHDLILKANILALRSDYEGVLEIASKLGEKPATKDVSKILVAKVFMALGQNKEAISLLAGNSHATAKWIVAKASYILGDKKEAIKNAKDVVRANPADFRASILLWHLLPPKDRFRARIEKNMKKHKKAWQKMVKALEEKGKKPLYIADDHAANVALELSDGFYRRKL